MITVSGKLDQQLKRRLERLVEGDRDYWSFQTTPTEKKNGSNGATLGFEAKLCKAAGKLRNSLLPTKAHGVLAILRQADSEMEAMLPAIPDNAVKGDL